MFRSEVVLVGTLQFHPQKVGGVLANRSEKLSFIVNPLAGTGGQGVLDILGQEMETADRSYEVFTTEYRGHAKELAKQAAERGTGTVVAVGGDGTLNEVARGILGSESSLGLLPRGSGNAFARYANIPLKFTEACKALLDSEHRMMDVGKVGEEIFLSSAGFGMDAEVCRRFNSRPGGRRGTMAYVLLSVDTFRSYQPTHVKVEMDGGRTFECDPHIITVANTSQYGNGATIAPGARADDGVLDVCVIEDVTLLKGLWHTRRLFDGTIDQMPGVRMFQCEELRIRREGSGWFQVDGDAREGPEIAEVSVIPRAISVAVPRCGDEVRKVK
jgi:diacylglycerol kinase (ATP)